GSIATKLYYNEQFTNGRQDIQQAKELIHKVIFTYAMSEDFVLTSQQEEALLKESVLEVTTLLKTLEKALSEISNYLLLHENISHEECKEILRDIF
ncbi:MAG: ATP-dependent metallopeptidase FtsH/Yme1/Tma family protein, partial [Sulfurovum sp.]